MSSAMMTRMFGFGEAGSCANNGEQHAKTNPEATASDCALIDASVVAFDTSDVGHFDHVSNSRASSLL